MTAITGATGTIGGMTGTVTVMIGGIGTTGGTTGTVTAGVMGTTIETIGGTGIITTTTTTRVAA
jgi:hypothetical protein